MQNWSHILNTRGRCNRSLSHYYRQNYHRFASREEHILHYQDFRCRRLFLRDSFIFIPCFWETPISVLKRDCMGVFFHWIHCFGVGDLIMDAYVIYLIWFILKLTIQKFTSGSLDLSPIFRRHGTLWLHFPDILFVSGVSSCAPGSRVLVITVGISIHYQIPDTMAMNPVKGNSHAVPCKHGVSFSKVREECEWIQLKAWRRQRKPWRWRICSSLDAKPGWFCR